MHREDQLPVNTPSKLHVDAPVLDCQNCTCGSASDKVVLCLSNLSCWWRSKCQDHRSRKTTL